MISCKVCHGETPQAVTIHPDGRERRRDQRTERDVVESDDGDVVGHPSAPRREGLDRADGHEVVVGEEAVHIGVFGEEACCGLGAAVDGGRSGDAPVRVHTRVGAGVAETVLAPPGPISGKVGGDHGKPAAARGREVVDGEGCAVGEVGSDRNDSRVREPIVHDDDRNGVACGFDE